MTVQDQLVRALSVIVLDPLLRDFLEANDPQALQQALQALRAAKVSLPPPGEAADRLRDY